MIADGDRIFGTADQRGRYRLRVAGTGESAHPEGRSGRADPSCRGSGRARRSVHCQRLDRVRCSSAGRCAGDGIDLRMPYQSDPVTRAKINGGLLG